MVEEKVGEGQPLPGEKKRQQMERPGGWEEVGRQ